MGEIWKQVPDPDQTLDCPGMTDQQLFDTARRVFLWAGQADHYKSAAKKVVETFWALLTMIAIIAGGAFFVIIGWGLLPNLFSK